MTPPSGGYLGEFEQLVLLAILRLDDDAYGATIRRLIQTAAGRDVSIGALYTTLARLHEKGFVTPHLGEPTGERGGRRRKIYTLTAAGHAAMARAYESFTNMVRGLRPKLAR
jgi:DNA-binding PadR family transcriptional regulator